MIQIVRLSTGKCHLPINRWSALQSTQIRNMGIFGDTISNFAKNRAEVSKDKKFAEMMQTMLTTPRWTLRPLKKTVEDQVNSWLSYIPGLGAAEEKKQLKAFKGIIHEDMLDAMTDDEIDNPLSIGPVAKERIAKSSNRSTSEISQLIQFYKQSLIVQKWLIIKNAKGERLPNNEVELQMMQQRDTRVRAIVNEVMNNNTKVKKGRGRSLPF